MKLKSLTTILLFLLPIAVFSQVKTGNNAKGGNQDLVEVSPKVTTDNSTDSLVNKENSVLELSLEDAIYRALKNNLGLKSNGFNFDKTKWSLYTCWNTFLPTINGTAGFTINPLDEDKRKGSAAIGAVLTKPEQGWSDLVNYEYTTPQVMPTLGINVSWNFNAAMIFSASVFTGKDLSVPSLWTTTTSMLFAPSWGLGLNCS